MEHEKIEINLDTFKNILNMFSSINGEDTNMAVSVLNNADTKIIHLKLLYKNLNPFSRGIFYSKMHANEFSDILTGYHPKFVMEWCRECLLETIQKEINMSDQDLVDIFEFTKKNYEYEYS